MCDFFWQRMKNNTDQLGGDLSDIIRSTLNQSDTQSPTDTWHFPTVDSDLLSFRRQTSATSDFIDQGDLFGMSDQSVVASNDVKAQGSNNIFSRVLQISPSKHSPISPRVIRPTLHHDRLVKIDHTAQISPSPRPLSVGTKRRKGQGKKVVCVPAPAAASSRSSGEVVPSDLWAWRKYGQKPIKGSPYPRGYYRCSSSKGCSARKQVERSRTDPNMLVITYTSDHNHPWPTQRNALAGSTRFQPSKSKINTSASSSSSKKPSNITKDNHSEKSNTDTKTINVKEEPILNEQIPMDTEYTFNQDLYNDQLISSCSHTDDFFADLAELESDPMSLIFTTPDDEEDQKGSDKGLDVDPFVNMFDWGKGL